MRRSVFFFVAALALISACSGIWFGGLRDELEIAKAFERFPRLDDTPFFRCADSFYWASYAREMTETGNLRVRSTPIDNAPYGRPNWGWASLNAWYLVALGKAWSVAAGIPLRQALLTAAMWSGPILYFLALAAILALGCWARNFPAAVAAALILGTAPRVFDDFAFAVPGHHGWHDLACFATLVLLAAAIRKGNARLWFAAAGLAGAVALWIGATQQGFGLGAAGLGALVAMIVSRGARRAEPSALTANEAPDFPTAESWRVFGVTGAIAALVFYLIEYAPGPFAMRLEINHPIYALGFLLGGEFLCRAQRSLFSTRESRTIDLVIAVASATALAGIAAVVFFGPAEWHTMRQPFMQRLHHEIAEFQPLTFRRGLLILGAPIFLVGAGFWCALAGGRALRDRMALLVCASPCAMAIALSFVQLRWAGIAGASAAALASVLFADLGTDRLSAAKPPVKQRTAAHQAPVPLFHTACIILALGLMAGWSAFSNRGDARQVEAAVIDRLATMEVASVLKSDPNVPNPIAIFCGQKERQAWINYVSGVRSVGSLYWDNPSGMRAEAEFLATYDEEAAHRIARARGINYLVITRSGGDVIAYHYMWQGNKSDPRIRQTLAYRLAGPSPTAPRWLQLLSSSTPAIRREGIRVYRVVQ